MAEHANIPHESDEMTIEAYVARREAFIRQETSGIFNGGIRNDYAITVGEYFDKKFGSELMMIIAKRLVSDEPS